MYFPSWENRRANFILHMKAGIEVAVREHQWFKFLLHHEGGKYQRLEHTVFTSQKFIKKNVHGERVDSKGSSLYFPSWENRRANFILHMKAGIEVAVREHQWFKFLLHHEGGKYQRLEHTVFTSQKFIKKNVHGERVDSKICTRQIPLNLRVESHFRGEFLCGPNELFHGSYIERCFSPLLYPPPRFEDHPPAFEDSQYYDSDYDNGSYIERCFSPLLYPPPRFEDHPPAFEDSQYYDLDYDNWDCPCGGVDLLCICLLIIKC